MNDNPHNLSPFAPWLQEIRAMSGGILAIDGLCGSGKTEFARLIAREFPCNVIHTDDFYLPMDQRKENWREIPGGNMDFHRLLRQVLEPCKAGKPISFRPYSCREKCYGAQVALSIRPLTVIEGSYSHHPLLAPYYDKKIFLTCERNKQKQRLRLREGEGLSRFENLWIPMEQLYHRTCGLPGDAVVIDTTDYF